MAQEDGSPVTSSTLQFFPWLSPGIGSPYSPWLRELKSEDRGLCLIQLLYYYGNLIANQNYVSNPRSRKPMVRSESMRTQVHPADAAPVTKRSSSHDDLRGFKFKREKVMILWRGESLDLKMNEKGGLAGTGTARLRPGPEMVQKTNMYAGSTFAVSPEPSSLLLPSFSRKKQVLKVIDDDSATRDLRLLLRLD